MKFKDFPLNQLNAFSENKTFKNIPQGQIINVIGKKKKISEGGGSFKGKYSPTSKLYQTYLFNVGKYYVFENEIKIFKMKNALILHVFHFQILILNKTF